MRCIDQSFGGGIEKMESSFKTYRDVFEDDFATQFGEYKEAFLNIKFTDSLEINVEDVASVLDIDVESSDMEQSGLIESSGNKAVIKVNQSEVSYRQRFTIAHEIGHKILRHLDQDAILYRAVQTFDPAIENKLQERQANDFAANLLMPGKLVSYYIDELNIKDINILAQKFDVSSLSMEYRLINLGYI